MDEKKDVVEVAELPRGFKVKLNGLVYIGTGVFNNKNEKPNDSPCVKTTA